MQWILEELDSTASGISDWRTGLGQVILGSTMRGSEYIHWAKTHFGAHYNLARSGVPPIPLERLEPSLGYLLQTAPHSDGWPPLRQAIAARYETTPESVVTVHGASMANHIVCATLLQPGDEVVIETPVYEPLRSVPEYMHARIHAVPRDERSSWKLEIKTLEKAMTPQTRLVVLTNLHNPTGDRFDTDTLNALATIADDRSCHILIDEVYLEFLYGDGECTAASLSPWFIATRSLTKAYGLGSLRIGWIIAEPELAERMRRLHDLFAAAVSHPAERLATLLINRADEFLSPTVMLLNDHLKIVDDFVHSHERLSWVRPTAGTVGLVKLREGSVDDLVENLASRHDTLVTPDRFFGTPNHFRIGWGVDPAILDEGLRRLAQALA